MGGGQNGTDLITVTPSASCSHALRGVANTINVLFEIHSESDPNTVRPSYDLAIVLDKSGSMGGLKLENCKKAIMKVVENMGSNDRLHFITYDTDVQIVFENGNLKNPQSLQALVASVNAGSCTNISGGLLAARDILLAHKDPERNMRIFLYSDGLANRGVTEPKELWNIVDAMHDQGIVTSAFGIGDDFNEELMSTIAEYGRGDYCFIDHEKNINKYIKKALRGLLSLIGTNGELKIRGRNGSIVRKIYGHDDVVRGAQLGDVREDNHRQIVCALDVTPLEANEGEVLEWTLTYKPTNNPLEYATLAGKLSLKFTDDDALLRVETPETDKVNIALAIVQASDVDEHIVELLDANKIDEAIAAKTKSLETLETIKAKDVSGFIEAILNRGRKTVAEMNQRTNVGRMRKYVAHECAMERAMSAASLCYDDEMDTDLW